MNAVRWSESRRVVESMVCQTEDAFGARVSKVPFDNHDDASQKTRESSPTKHVPNPHHSLSSNIALYSTSSKNQAHDSIMSNRQIIRDPSHAGSWYTSSKSQLNSQLDGWLDDVKTPLKCIGPQTEGQEVKDLPVPGARIIIGP
jgi:hypothetical protein